MNFLDYNTNGVYRIIDEHDMEILDGMGLGMGVGMGVGMDLDGVELIDNHNDAGDAGSDMGNDLDILSEVEFLEALEGCEKHEEQEKREINRKSMRNIVKEKSSKMCDVTVEMREVELSINTSTIEEVIFKKHRVEIIDKRTRVRIMEGVISGYTLVGRVYDPDIVMDFEDGRSFYNDNFGYLMRFYI